MSNFRIRVQQIIVGWCSIRLYFNHKEMDFDASYLGQNPISSLIEACADLKEAANDKEELKINLIWYSEPGILQIDLRIDRNQNIHFDVYNKNEDEAQSINEEWHGTESFTNFSQSVISEGFRVLKAFGLYGYYCAWCNNEEFPLMTLLQLANNKTEDCNYNESSWENEFETFSRLNDATYIKEERHYEECTIFYESWQMQCCGKPFAVGDKVDWTGVLPYEFPLADGIIIDFAEEHHGFAFLSIKGTVDKIIAHRSEYPKGKRCTNYYKAKIISQELLKTDGQESELPDDDTTERIFWGYVVTLKAVVVKPLKKDLKSLI